MNADELRDKYGFTKNELSVAMVLIAHKGANVSRATLLAEVWGVPADLTEKMDTRSVDMTISRVRSKMAGKARIRSVRGIGYRYKEENV